MIIRTVFFKLNEAHANEAGRRAVIETTRNVFRALADVQRFSICIPADTGSAAAWDFMLQVEFASMEHVERYGKDPDHRSYVDEFLNARVAAKKAWNFKKA